MYRGCVAAVSRGSSPTCAACHSLSFSLSLSLILFPLMSQSYPINKAMKRPKIEVEVSCDLDVALSHIGISIIFQSTVQPSSRITVLSY